MKYVNESETRLGGKKKKKHFLRPQTSILGEDIQTPGSIPQTMSQEEH